MKTLKTQAPDTDAIPEFFSPQVAEARRFYLDLNPPRQLRLVVVSGGVEHCTPDYAIRRDTFPFYAVEYVARGHGELKLGKRIRALQPGRIFSYGPGVPHHITGDRNDALVKYFVNFTGKGALDLLGLCRLAPGRIAQVSPPNALSALFDELILSGLNSGRRSADLCVKLLECLVLKIAGANAPLEGVETLAFGTYQQCRRHIEQHFLRLRTLEQIAEECHTNNAYLCRLFRRYDRETPYHALLRLKMNHAAERLQQPEILVKQIAQEVGFADPFHFSRVFKSVLGLAPNAFRALR